MERITVEKAQADEAGFSEVFELLIQLHKEGGYAPMNVEKAAKATFLAIEEEMTFVARVNEKPVGVIVMTEVAFWYSDDTFIQDVAFFVLPEHRGGNIGVSLLRAVRDEAQRRMKVALVTVSNPDRRPKRTTASLLAQTAGYVPLGYTIKLR